MTRRLIIWLALTVVYGCSPTELSPPDLHDRVDAAASDLRWTKQTSGVADVRLHYPRPVLVFARPPGRYSSEQLAALAPTPESKEWIGSRRAAPIEPSLYVYGPGRSEKAAYFHNHVSVPNARALWKQDDGSLEVSLERQGDEVHIVGIR
jgi:hypothetical protein